MPNDPLLDHDSLVNAPLSTGSVVASPVTSSPPTTPPTTSSPTMTFRRPIRRYDSTLSNGQPYRRGSSNEFETFDELLRAAGYKETRVLSPEMERQEILEQEAEERRQQRRSFVQNYGPLTGRVAHFLSTYIIPANANGSSLEPSPPAQSLSGSVKEDLRTFHRQPSRAPDHHPNTLSLHSPQSSSSIHSDRTSQEAESAAQAVTSPSTTSTPTVRPIVPSPSRPPHARLHLRTTASSPHLRSPDADDVASCIAPATAALLQAQVRQSRTRQPPHGRSRLPLPDTWLDTFARAVLGSRASRPNTIRRNSSRNSSRKSQSLATRRNTNAPGSSTNGSSWGRKGSSLSGRNSNVTFGGPGPGPGAMRSSTRATDKLLARSYSNGPAIVSTSKTRVVCRSSSTGAGRHTHSRGGYGSDSSRGGSRTPILTPAREGDPLWGDVGSFSLVVPPVPSLPAKYAAFSTQIPSVRVTRTKGIVTNRGSVTDDEWECDYDDDDDDEPHLSNIFVPVSRQRSIRSLRACLDKHAQGSSTSHLSPRGHPMRERVRNPLFRSASHGQPIYRQNSGFEEDEDGLDPRGRVGAPWSQDSKIRGGRLRGRVIWGWGEDDG